MTQNDFEFPFAQVNTRTWRISLGDSTPANSQAVEWLRTEFFKLRKRAGLILSEINRDLPDFTQHDLSHCDALWEMADFVGGEELQLNPMEGFVLGAVFLLHDAALTLAALPNRLADLQNDPLWLDTVVAVLSANLERKPTDEEIAQVANGRDRATQQLVAATVLRERHPQNAERLAVEHYRDSRGEHLHLIQDDDLRAHFGRDIGLIASSHGLSIDAVVKDFATLPLLPPVAGRCPATWQVDRLKLACLIRTCDAIHLDSRRAPHFLQAIRRPSANSEDHWRFQQRISIARDGDRIRFASGYPFPASEASAWWIGYGLVQNADKELRQVDALLSDLGRPRFKALRVFGAESPERLAQAIPTEGWEPIEARVRVSDAAKIAGTLGGSNLYGSDYARVVPLRELIQNAVVVLIRVKM